MAAIGNSNSEYNRITRLAGIDAFRVFALFFVVMLHAFQPAGDASGPVIMLTYTARWAVPFFFITTGYFLGLANPETFPAILKLTKRILPVFVFWLLLYAAFFNKLPQLVHPKVLAHYFISGGSAFHLWFLPALGISAAGVLLCRRFGFVVLFSIGIILYFAGLAFGSYRELLSLPEIPYPHGGGFKVRWGPFLGFILVASGYYLGTTKNIYNLKSGLALSVMGFLMQLSEAALISTPIKSFDYVLGTLFFGLGMFLVALHFPANRVMDKIAMFGPVVLGGYCIHLFFIKIFARYFDQHDILSALAMGGGTLILSLAVAYAMSFIPVLKRLVK